MTGFGKELILDLHQCNPKVFTRSYLDAYFIGLCKLIDMEMCERYFWDDLDTPEEEKETEEHLVGTSAIQFIKTSNITIHTLDLMERVYINIFSCKDFKEEHVEVFTQRFFGGTVVNKVVVERI